jgi:F-type H+-transporting ATPase subunit b
MDLHPVDLLYHGLNIIVLFILLRLIIWKPVLKYLNAREQRIKDEVSAAEKSREEASALKAEYERSIEEVDAQGREILRDSQLRAGEQAKEMLRHAKEQTETMLAEAHEKIEAEKAQAVVDTRYEITQIAAEMAARILKREVKPEDNLFAAQDFFDETR